MPVKIPVCMCERVLKVSPSVKSRVDEQEGLRTKREQGVTSPGLKGLLSLCFTFFWLVSFLSEYVENCLLSVHAGFHFQLKMICIWSLGSGCWKAGIICSVQIWTWIATAQETGDTSSPGFLSRSYILTVSAFPVCCKHNLHPFCLLRGEEIEATEMFPGEWLIFTLQECSRIATSTNH